MNSNRMTKTVERIRWRWPIQRHFRAGLVALTRCLQGRFNSARGQDPNPNPKKTSMITKGILAPPPVPRQLLVVLATLSGALLLHAQSVVQFATGSTTIPEATPQVTLAVSRTNDVDTVVSVNYSSSDGTALAGLDYAMASGTLIFDVGVSNLVITVPILNDGSRENAEIFRVSLSNPTNALLGSPEMTEVTVQDNDPGFQLEFASYTVHENAGSVVVAITRGPEATSPATVKLATANVSAMAGSDYTATTGTLSFAPGEERKLVAIPILNDGLKEPSKTFRAELSAPTGDALGIRSYALVTITDNDPGLQVEFSTYTAHEAAGVAMIAVVRGPDENSPATVDFTTVNGGALAASDYAATNGTLSFTADEKRKWVAIQVLNDALKEPNETLRLNLSNPTGDVLGTRWFATLTIEDNDPGFRLETTNYWCHEGSGELVITVTRGPDEESPATVDFATSNLSALAGSDYAATNGTLSFAAEEESKQFRIPILNDGVKEASETFRLDLSNAVGGLLGTSSNAIVTVEDNDAGFQVELSTYWVREDAKEAVIAVTAGPDASFPATIDFATANIVAMAGSDYTATNGTLSFAAGERRKWVSIPILQDSINEAAESFRFNLSNPVGDVLGTRSYATVAIEDNNPGFQVEFVNYWARENSGAVVIAVTRGPDENWPATVDYATEDVTAIAEQDFHGTNGTLSFAVGESVKFLPITILNDGLKEATETFRLTLSNATGGSVLGAARLATVNLEDNDPGVQFTMAEGGWFTTVSNWVHESEGVVRMAVTRGNDGFLGPFTVQCSAAGLTATPGVDFLFTNGVVEFSAGEMLRFIDIPIIDDGAIESDERFTVTLSHPTEGMWLGAFSSETATICDTTEMRPHRFEQVEVLPNGQVALTLGGGYTLDVGLSNRFQPYYDLYPLEVSTNLVDWAPLVWLLRTNAAATTVTYLDKESGQFSQRFYRTPTNILTTPSLWPTGPYPVGRVDRLIQDANQRNLFRISTNGSFAVTVWYPAQRVAGQLPMPYYYEAMVHRYDWWFDFLDVVPFFWSLAVSNAPMHPNASACPVVLLSAGWLAGRMDLQDKCAELASHGYVVVDIDQFDFSLSVLPDATCHFLNPNDTLGRELTSATLLRRIQSLTRTLLELEEWNQQDPLFAGRFDLQKLGAVGYSFGTDAALLFCSLEPRCLAAINLDTGALLMPRNLAKPTLSMNHSTTGDVNSGTVPFDNTVAPAPAYWFQISSTVHTDFGDFSWWGSPRPSISKLAQNREATRTMNAYMLWFLNRYVRGINEPMPPPSNYPRVINFRQK